MIHADKPDNEDERLECLLDYQILDTDADVNFDELTELASSLCDSPIALVSLIDETRQWFKSHHGLATRETPRELAFCSHAILQDDILEIPDSRQDERFSNNPLVTEEPRVIFYAGAPLVTSEGFRLGTLCVIDHKPKKLSSLQRRHLRIAANQVVAQLELIKSNRLKNESISQLRHCVQDIKQKNLDLYEFSTRAAHDISAPLRHIRFFSELSVGNINEGDMKSAIKNYQFIFTSCKKLQALVDDTFKLHRADATKENNLKLNLDNIVQGVIDDIAMSIPSHGVNIRYNINTTQPFYSQPIRVKQILYNLISNSVKYCNKDRDQCSVDITLEEEGGKLSIVVKDNGIGIPDAYHKKFFEPFERFNPDMAEGSGLGASIMKKHVEMLEGNILFSSSENGTEFFIQLPNNQ